MAQSESSLAVNALASLPTVLEVDLVFPRHDTDSPVYLFLIVMALRCAAATLNYNLSATWILMPTLSTVNYSGPRVRYLTDDPAETKSSSLYYMIQPVLGM